jgi:CHAT domain-containing protein
VEGFCPDDELDNIRAALEPWEAMGVVAASLDENLTLSDILDRIRAETPDVVHLICHGVKRHDRHHLLLTDERGGPAYVNEDQLRAAFSALPERRVSLLILQACDSGPDLRSGLAMSGLAPSLARLGISAVIAMQYSVNLPTAQRFAAAFYAALANNNPADVAVTAARQALQARYGTHRRDFGIPLCYVTRADALRRYP